MKKTLLATAAVTLGTAACGLCGCIARGSRVRTSAGTRLIEELCEGDAVLCVDPESGALASGRVAAVGSLVRECVRLDYGDGALICTSDHPLYCPDTRVWAPAGDWVLGRRARLLIVERELARAVEVRSSSSFAGIHDVFDLTVEHPLHNFVVNGVLVHNKDPWNDCEAPDAGYVYQYEPCVCPNGGEGIYACHGSNGEGRRLASCTECSSPEDGGTDGGDDAGMESGDGGE